MTQASEKLTPAAFVHETRKVLERDGWVQGNYHSGGGHCLIGAMGVVRREHRLMTDSVFNDSIQDAIRRHIWPMAPVQWNDAPERAYEDVMKLLKDVEYDLDQDQSP